MLLDTIEAFKKKILAWIPETQYVSLIHIINEIFVLHIFESKKTITIRLEYNIRWYMYYFIYSIFKYNNKYKL